MNIVYVFILSILISSGLFCSSINDESKSLKISSSQQNNTHTNRMKEILGCLNRPMHVSNKQINELINYINCNSKQQSSSNESDILSTQQIIKAMNGKVVDSTKLHNFIGRFNESILFSYVKIIDQNTRDNIYNQFFLKHGKDIETFFSLTHNIVRSHFVLNNLSLSDHGIMHSLNKRLKIIFFYNEQSKSFTLGNFSLKPDQDYSCNAYYFTLTNQLNTKLFIMDCQEILVEENGIFICKENFKNVGAKQYFGRNSAYPFMCPFEGFRSEHKISEVSNQIGPNIWKPNDINVTNNLITVDNSEKHYTDTNKNYLINYLNKIKEVSNQIGPNIEKLNDINVTNNLITVDNSENHYTDTNKNYFINYLNKIKDNKPDSYCEFFPIAITAEETTAENYAFYHILNQEPQKFSAIKKVINAINDFVNTNSVDQIDTNSNNQMAVEKSSDLIPNSSVIQTIQDQAARYERNYIADLKQEFAEQSEQQQQLEKEWQQIRERVISGGSNKNNKKSISNKNKKPFVPNKPRSALASQTESQYINGELSKLKQIKTVKVRKAVKLVNNFFKDNGVSETTQNLTVKVRGSHWTFHASGMSPFTLVMPHGNKKGFSGSVLTNFLSNIKASNKN